MRRIWALGLAVVVVVAGCGRSEDQRRAEEARQSVERAAEDMAKGLEGLARAAEGMAGSGTAAKVEPASFDDLQSALPQVAGWAMDGPRSERMGGPVPFSQTEATYTRGGARVEARIVDSTFNQMLLAPWATFLAPGFERQTGDGHERSVQVEGHPGFERWERDQRYGELNLVVAKRFLVTFEGHDIDDAKLLHDFARQADLGRLASLVR